MSLVAFLSLLALKLSRDMRTELAAAPLAPVDEEAAAAAVEVLLLFLDDRELVTLGTYDKEVEEELVYLNEDFMFTGDAVEVRVDDD